MLVQANLGSAQLTADSIQRYLIGKWEICGVNQQSFYFDSDAATDFSIQDHDEFSFKDSTLTFFSHGTFSINGASRKKQYRISRLLDAYESPFKIALGKTEFIFEIRYPGFLLHRPILGTLDESESYTYFFSKIGKCK